MRLPWRRGRRAAPGTSADRYEPISRRTWRCSTASPSTSRVKPAPRSRSALRAGIALRASRPTMNRCAKPFICRLITLFASGATGECPPARLMPQRRTLGASTPCRAKYSRRWRLTSRRLRSVGKTSTKRSISILRCSSDMAHSIISPCQRSGESSDGLSSRAAARICRAVIWMRSSRALPGSTGRSPLQRERLPKRS
jgi:hypothetical protein